MKLRLLLFSFLSFWTFSVLVAEPPSCVQTKDGVIVFTDPLFTGISRAIKLEVIADNIIRVIAAPGKEIASRQSLITVYTKRNDLVFNVIPSKINFTLKTKSLTAIVNLQTGTISFFDSKGKKILNEKPIAGRHFQSAVFDGKRYYNLTQTFQSTSDDAWYGLGQHQDGIINYRGQ